MKIAGFIINKLMAVWIIVFGLLAFFLPGSFLWLHAWVTYLLGGVILVMSLTLTLPSVTDVFTRPKAIIGGFFVKWITVPLVAYLAAIIVYSHQPALAAGTILDGSVPAGVSSNLFTYIGHGSVALAVSLTFIHTILSPLLTPALTKFLASKFVVVNFLSLLIQMLELVIVPVGLGLAIRYGLGQNRIKTVEPVLPMISAIFLFAITLGLVSAAAATIRANIQWVPIVVGTTSVLIIVNLAAAYGLGKALRLSERQARAIMFDTGVYNSGLGAVLAATNFGAFSALPPLMNATMNLILGALLAAFLANRTIPPLDVDTGTADTLLAASADGP